MKVENNVWIADNVLTAGQIICLINRMLGHINKNIAEHSELTAYLALAIYENSDKDFRINPSTLFLLAYFHSIGFYKFDTFSNELDFFSKKSNERYNFGYFYLKHMTPFQKESYALEFFNQDYIPELSRTVTAAEYTSIIYIASIAADFFRINYDVEFPNDINKISKKRLNPTYAAIFNKIIKTSDLQKVIKSKKTHTKFERIAGRLCFNSDDTTLFLKLMVATIDFKSTSTVFHTINTACYACTLAQRLGCSGEEINRIFEAGLLHDVGKIATPTRILESTQRLDSASMTIMKMHVNHTRNILQDIVPSEIAEIACNHHEQLDGNGYPRGIAADKLNILDRILAIADLTSALQDSRSYKKEYDKDQTIQILQENSLKNKIDSKVVDYLVKNFDSVKEEMLFRRSFFELNTGSVNMDYYLNEIESTKIIL